MLAVVIVGALLAVWAFNAVYRVDSDEVGIELRFGKAKPEDNPPGLHMLLWPFETVETPRVTAENKENIGFELPGSRNAQAESLMLTGDQNIVDMKFTVLWRIRDPRDFLFNVTNQDQLVRVSAESAMREIVGRTPAEIVRTTGRQEIQETVKQMVQATLDSYGAGIVIQDVNIEEADPPDPVNDAFEEVQRAKQDQDKFIEEANRYANRRLGQARGEAAQIREEAEAYKGRVIAEAQGEAERFVKVFEEYSKAPEVTRKRLFLETLEQVLANSSKVIIQPGAGESVVPYLPLPEVQKRLQRNDQQGDQQ